MKGAETLAVGEILVEVEGTMGAVGEATMGQWITGVEAR
jgi:hypothetical protein